MQFSTDTLRLNADLEVGRIGGWLRAALTRHLRRRGLVIGLSGGVDSSVTAALAVRALGPERVFGLLMPEHHSEEATQGLSEQVADHLGIERLDHNISPLLEAVGFYEGFTRSVQRVLPEYQSDWACKIITPDVTRHKGFTYFSLVAQAPGGEPVTQRLSAQAYLEIVAWTNYKQRFRKMLEYHHADRLHYAVAGTPNRLEYDQGFFVKNGDGSADVKPIAHLYKSQVYQLAEHLGLPEAIRCRPPTTDTYSMAQGQDEFYFSLPYQQMDLCLYAFNHGLGAAETAEAAGLTAGQVERVWKDIATKRTTTRYLQLSPLLVDDIPEVGHDLPDSHAAKPTQNES